MSGNACFAQSPYLMSRPRAAPRGPKRKKTPKKTPLNPPSFSPKRPPLKSPSPPPPPSSSFSPITMARYPSLSCCSHTPPHGSIFAAMRERKPLPSGESFPQKKDCRHPQLPPLHPSTPACSPTCRTPFYFPLLLPPPPPPPAIFSSSGLLLLCCRPRGMPRSTVPLPAASFDVSPSALARCHSSPFVAFPPFPTPACGVNTKKYITPPLLCSMRFSSIPPLSRLPLLNPHVAPWRWIPGDVFFTGRMDRFPEGVLCILAA